MLITKMFSDVSKKTKDFFLSPIFS